MTGTGTAGIRVDRRVGPAGWSFGEAGSAGRDRVNRSQIAARVAGRTGLARPEAADVADTVFEVIAEALAGGEEVRLVGFGIFGVKDHPARTWRNPGTGGWMRVAPSRAPTFRAGKPLRDAVREGDGSRSAGR